MDDSVGASSTFNQWTEDKRRASRDTNYDAKSHMTITYIEVISNSDRQDVIKHQDLLL